MKIYVTSACYDNIGQILNKLKIEYKPYKGNFDCDILFLNCGSSDTIDTSKLNAFAKNGGIVYASDLMSSTIDTAFPNIFNFKSSGSSEKITANVVDSELVEVIGQSIKITFDMGGWSVLKSISKGNIILNSAKTGYPIMVKVPYGKGIIYYTCFHNNAQANEKEEILLKLLVLKQISDLQSVTLDQVSNDLNIDLDEYRDKFDITPVSKTQKVVNPPKKETPKTDDIFDKWANKSVNNQNTTKPNSKPNTKDIFDKF